MAAPPSAAVLSVRRSFLCIAAVAAFIYLNALPVPFQYDDRAAIVKNTDIRDLSDIKTVLLSEAGGFVRPPVSLSFALNYHWGALHPVGYHLVNLLLHILNGMLVYVIFRVIDESTPPGNRSHPGYVLTVPLLSALLFVSHPIQTEAVTYIWGRSDLLCAFFYLLSVFFFLKASGFQLLSPARHEGNRLGKVLYYSGALLSFGLALGSKALAISLPLVLLFCDYYFIARGERHKWWKHVLLFHLPFLGLAAVRLYLHYSSDIFFYHPSSSSPFLSETPWDNKLGFYTNLFTQSHVLVQYLWLLIFPAHLNIDHDVPPAQAIFDVTTLSSLGVLLLLAGLALFLYHRSKVASFGMVWFLVILSFFFFVALPDFLVERRVYLPSVGLCVCLALVLSSGVHRLALVWSQPRFQAVCQLLPMAVIFVYAITAIQRNEVWRDPSTLWQDAVIKSPHKVRPHLNLAIVSLQQKKFEVAITEATRALELDPAAKRAHYCLLDAYTKSGHWAEAVARFRETLYAYPSYAAQWYLRRYTRLRSHAARLQPALIAFEKDLTGSSGNADGYLALGLIYYVVAQDEQRALQYFEEGLKSRPRYFRRGPIRELVQNLRKKRSVPQHPQEQGTP